MKKSIAVVLMNLGGPLNQQEVRPFLFSLFYDKNIIRLAKIWRWLIAIMISIFRTPKAKRLYAKMGGGSPILAETEQQRQTLADQLKTIDKFEAKIFIAMRHSKPGSYEVIQELKTYKPDQIILLPLYPQFSTTTTKSAVDDFIAKYKGEAIVKSICCYFNHIDFVASHATIINNALANIQNLTDYVILFSAHSLPVSIIEQGDPYQWQIEQSVKTIVAELDYKKYQITYQSRISPVRWLKPDTGEVVKHLAEEGKSIIIVPIAFVSEHVETLVELDIDYKDIALKHNVDYIRLPTLRVETNFIKALSQMIVNIAAESSSGTYSSAGQRNCPHEFSKCPCMLAV